jgi:hypothetical protein
MVFFIAIGAYFLFLVLMCLFLEGAVIRESPKTQLVDGEIGSLPRMRFDAPSAMLFEPEGLGEWGEEVDLSTSPLAQSNLRGSGWQSEAGLSRP